MVLSSNFNFHTEEILYVLQIIPVNECVKNAQVEVAVLVTNKRLYIFVPCNIMKG